MPKEIKRSACPYSPIYLPQGVFFAADNCAEPRRA